MNDSLDVSVVEVTQADRDAARTILWVKPLIDDEEAIVQAFARHRIAATRTPSAETIREAFIVGYRARSVKEVYRLSEEAAWQDWSARAALSLYRSNSHDQ